MLKTTKRKIAFGTGLGVLLLALAGALWQWGPWREEAEPPGGDGQTASRGLLLDVAAMESTEYGVKPDSGYRLLARPGTTLEELQASILLDPAVPFALEPLEKETFGLRLAEPLERNSILKVQVAAEGEEIQGWAFQTEKDFRFSGSHPGDGASQVAVDTGVEVAFTRKLEGAPPPEAFFSIEPYAEGSLSVAGNRIVFVPKANLLPDTLYKVQVRKGYGAEGEVLAGDAAFSFRTAHGDSTAEFQLVKEGPVTYLAPEEAGWIHAYAYGLPEEAVVSLKIHKMEDVEAFTALAGKNLYEVKGILERERLQTQVTQGKTRLVQSGWRQTMELPRSLEEGMYYVMAEVEGRQDGVLLQVTGYNAFGAVDRDELLVWLANGQGLSNVARVSYGDKLLGSTDREGFGKFPATVVEEERARILLDPGQGTPLVLFLQVAPVAEDPAKGYLHTLYTDRTLFLPTDEIRVFGMLVPRSGGRAASATLELQFEGKVLEEKPLSLSPRNTFQSAFSLEDYRNSHADLVLKVGDAEVGRRTLTVAMFEKPTYNLEASLSKELVEMGQTVELEGWMGYYEGTPLGGETVVLDSWQADLGGRPGTRQQMVQSDSTGHFRAVLTPHVETESWWPEYVQVRTRVGALESFYDTKEAGFVLFPRDVQLVVETRKTGEGAMEFGLEVHRWDLGNYAGDPYDFQRLRGGAFSGKAVEVEIVESFYEKVLVGRTYDPIQKKTVETFDYNLVENTVAAYPLTTDGDGKASGTFSQVYKDRGYRLVVRLADSQGRPVREEAYYSQALADGEGMFEYYSLEGDKFQAALGESVSYAVHRNGTRLAATGKEKILAMTWKDGFRESRILQGTELSVTFEESMVPNATIAVVFFDGGRLHHSYDLRRMLGLDIQERRLQLEVEPDKERYTPGETVEVSLTTRDPEGNPIGADVNLSVVDEAFFALAEDGHSLLEEVYSYLHDTGIRGTVLAGGGDEGPHGGAEQGGEGSAARIRENFVHTAFFQTVQTDADGKGTVRFTLPDNLTSFRITANALAMDAGGRVLGEKVKGSIQVGLPFFLDLRVFQEYLVQDDVALTWTTGGTAGFLGDDSLEAPVAYEAALVREGTGEIESHSGSVPFRAYNQLPLGVLEEGKWTLTLTASTGSLSDAVSKEFAVVPSRQHLELVREELLADGMRIPHNGQNVVLDFYNKASEERFQALEGIRSLSRSLRMEEKAAAYMVDLLLGEELEADLFHGVFQGDLYPYLGNQGMFKALPDGEESMEATAWVLAMGFPEAYGENHGEGTGMPSRAQMVQALSQAWQAADRPLEENGAALWALASLGEPVLLETKALLAESDWKKEPVAALFLALGLGEAGDLEKAREVLEAVAGSGRWEQADRRIQALGLALALEARRNGLAEEIYGLLKDGADRTYSTAAARYLYLSTLQGKDPVSRFRYTLEGRTQTLSLGWGKAERLVLDAQEADVVRFEPLEGETMVRIRHVGSAGDLTPTQGLTLTRRYLKDGKPVESVSVGDLVQVELVLEGGQELESEGFRYYGIDEMLPAGLAYVRIQEKTREGVWVWDRIQGKALQLSIGVWDGQDLAVTYEARAVASGNYHGEPAVARTWWDSQTAVSEPGSIRIRE
ncbi:Ig-like domain-containing protein [Anaerotalea alkaliphila]|uniref:Alpha-2-macroglobulin n=1 Tax=Anaerotalea alkaliphila TaxID=2662126 RepID=A0A7X5HTS5_9FIRM|nr:Ig-like domain-containing alpha-2-macroglobulin family protein [Anaerotalea alkaliphila]NDL66518.1 hypothetical protein [Anaerotalea alkaliphila]